MLNVSANAVPVQNAVSVVLVQNVANTENIVPVPSKPKIRLQNKAIVSL